MIFKLEKVMCLIVTALLILLQITCQDKIGSDVLCANNDCTGIISEFAVLVTYTPDSRHKIRAKKGDTGVILAKFRDEKIQLYKVKIKNEVGFLPSRVVQERAIVENAPLPTRLLVPAELVSTEKMTNPVVPSATDEKVPDFDEKISPKDDSPQLPTDQNVEQLGNESDSTTVEIKSDLNVGEGNSSASVTEPLTTEQEITEQSVIDSIPDSLENNYDETNSSVSENPAPKTNKAAEDHVPKNSTPNTSADTTELKNDKLKPNVEIRTPPPYVYLNPRPRKSEPSEKEDENSEKRENDTLSLPKPNQEIEPSGENATIEVSDNSTVKNYDSKDNVAVEKNDTSSTSPLETTTQPESHPKQVEPAKAIDPYQKTNEKSPGTQPENLPKPVEPATAIAPDQEMNPKSPDTQPESLVEHAEPAKAIDPNQEMNRKTPDTKDESSVTKFSSESVSETVIAEVDVVIENINSPANESEVTEQVIKSENSAHTIASETSTYLENTTAPEPTQQATQQAPNITKDTPSMSDDFKTPANDSNSDQNKPEATEVEKPPTPEIVDENATTVPSGIPLAPQPVQNADNPVDPATNVIVNTEEVENTTDTVQPLPASVPTIEAAVNSTEDQTGEENISANFDQVIAMKSEETLSSVDTVIQPEQNQVSEEIPNSLPEQESSTTTPIVVVDESTSPVAVQSTDQPPISGYFGTSPIISSFSANPETQQIEPNDNLSEKSIPSGSSESLNPDTTTLGGEAKPDIQSETTPFAFDTEEKHSLHDFIHGPRKKINENIETFDSQPEKSVYQTISEYLPNFSGFRINDVLPVDSIESFFGIFDFALSSQKQEEAPNGVCSSESFCGTDRLNSFVENHMTVKSAKRTTIPLWGEVTEDEKEQIVWTSGIISVILFVVIVILFLIDSSNKKNKNKSLIFKINELEKKFMIATKEIASLQDQLILSKSESNERQNIVETRRIGEVYEHKINQYKKRIVELEDKVSYLEKELEDVSSSALEMHKLLENSLTTQAHSKAAIDELETLQSLTESQQVQIEELTREINSIMTENQCLKVDSEMDKSAIKKLEKECSAQVKKNLELSEKNRNLTLQLDKEIENNNTLESNYKSEIYQLRSKLEDVEMNLKRSEFQVQELNRAFLDKQEGKTPEAVMAASDQMQLKMQVSTLEAMNVELSGQLKEEKNARRMVEEHVGDIIKELNNLKKTYESSEKERNEAVTKLQVLTQYFKDKETQLHKELEAKDKLYSERESKDQSLSQKLAFMREEISTLKAVNEELKKEIHDQEASYKVQLANAEQKTREHWFALRQAERKYKECQQEAASLRNKILVLETNLSSISQKVDEKNNSGMNGDIQSIIPQMMYHSPMSPELLPFPSPSEFIPPPPSEFIPPPPSPIPGHSPDFFPPEPLYSPDERLPPLGGRRAPTPPLPIPDDEFTPPPPNMKYAAGRNRNVEPPVPSYSRRTPPPNSRHRSFKPKPPRSSIDSPSSGMSLESLDKSGR